MIANVAYDIAEGCAVVVLSGASPNDDEWSEMVAWLHERASSSLLVVSYGGALSLSQREDMLGFLRSPHKPRAAFVTSSFEVRGAAAAMGWFLRDALGTFLLSESSRAYEFLSLDGPSGVTDVIARLEKRLEIKASQGLAR